MNMNVNMNMDNDHHTHPGGHSNSSTCTFPHQELSQYGIRVNAILPGFIETPMSAAVPDKVIQRFLTMIPMKRMGTRFENPALLLL